jgi:hypothetical protein
MAGNIPNGQKSAKLQNVARQSPSNPQMNIHETEIFNNDTTPLASNLPVTVSNPRPRPENIHVPDNPPVIGMNALSGIMAKVTYRLEAFTWLYRNLDFLTSTIKELLRYSHSTKLKKCVNFDPGHCNTSLDLIFLAKNLYPA